MNGAIRTTPAIRCMIGGMHRRSIPTIRSSSCKCKNNNHNALSSYYRYRSSTTKSKSEVSENPPTAKQLTMHALRIAVPMIGKLQHLHCKKKTGHRMANPLFCQYPTILWPFPKLQISCYLYPSLSFALFSFANIIHRTFSMTHVSSFCTITFLHSR